MLQRSKGVSFLRSRKRRRQPHSRTKLGHPKTGEEALEILEKTIEIVNTHKVHAPKHQTRVFSEVAEARQAATTQTQPAGRR